MVQRTGRWGLIALVTVACAKEKASVDQSRFPDGPCSYCEDTIVTDIPSFPGAEGFGSTTVGGRGGQVIEVTNLNDSGPGSLRAAVEARGARTVVFRVAGTINHSVPLKIVNPYITIAGQTAPGGGITLSGEELRVQTSNVLIRNIRVRTGDVDDPRDGWDNRDAANTGTPDLNSLDTGVAHIFFDHCSFSWSVDETLTFWFFTHDAGVQWSIIGEGLAHSNHPKGAHSMCNLISGGSQMVSEHHDLIADCNERNAQFVQTTADFRNNVIYNWGDLATEFEGNLQINVVNNYYKAGPNSASAHFPDQQITVDPAASTTMAVYVEGNVTPSNPDGTLDNWSMLVNQSTFETPSTTTRQGTAFPYPPVTTTNADVAYAQVLDRAGATPERRDAVDERIVGGVRANTGRIIDHTADVGGWPALDPGVPVIDTDHDGMPDAWELAHNLAPNDIADVNLDPDGAGYTNLERYLSDLAGDPTR